MAMARIRRQTAISGVHRILGGAGAAKSNLAIVDTTILDRLLNAVPPELLERFLAIELSDAPDPTHQNFGIWIRSKRDELKLTQSQFAQTLRQWDVKIHGSDVGNLEMGLRMNDYSEARLSAIRTAIIQAIVGTPGASAPKG